MPKRRMNSRSNSAPTEEGWCTLISTSPSSRALRSSRLILARDIP